MAAVLLIRRSSSSRLALTALSHFCAEKPPPLHSNGPLFSRSETCDTESFSLYYFPGIGSTRGFQTGLPLRAGFAAADYFDAEEKRANPGSPSGDGLEIAKLGIAPEIVSALARKGIMKLFPIQDL